MLLSREEKIVPQALELVSGIIDLLRSTVILPQFHFGGGGLPTLWIQWPFCYSGDIERRSSAVVNVIKGHEPA
jgi:hypothetical protein